ncbi:YXWGXW repeat-containing protein [Mucilaginibacter segetis]|uniref:YXWGXW repeat-containing protein n=1 Tax=Mucilaginibacter segetis TaxID=2793071 RepID=A0A934PTD6_9SPHI|nr:YXWGXW repeat-containing protein [Mucilaginibacter segetis]MBK0378821.1 YXWGXW repeat-containing protein [Mucilaginibacter segetis]
MKTLSKLGAVFAVAGLLSLSSCAHDYYVAQQPVEPVYVQPAPPSARVVWVPGGWRWRGGRYVYVNGYYARPRGRVYVKGHWEHTRHGYTWHKGYWKR